jgi:hypothetical protein
LSALKKQERKRRTAMIRKRAMVLLAMVFLVGFSGIAAQAQTDEITYCVEHGGWWNTEAGLCEYESE